MTFVPFIAALLAVWRVTHLVVVEDGPWDLFAAIRRLAPSIGLHGLLACFYCASVWIALAFALLFTRDWRELAVYVPALSGGAILLQRTTARDEPPVWIEQKEESS